MGLGDMSQNVMAVRGNVASYPGSSPAEKRGESLEELIMCPATYYVWFYAWF